MVLPVDKNTPQGDKMENIIYPKRLKGKVKWIIRSHATVYMPHIQQRLSHYGYIFVKY